MMMKLAILLWTLMSVQSRPYLYLENDERGGNVHSHIVRVNEDYNDESLRGFQEDDSVEEEIVAVNEAPRNKPRCQLFEGDLCLDEGDKAVVNHKRPEADMKRNVIRVQKKLWPNKVVYYSVDENLRDLRPKIADAIRAFHDKTCLKFREVDQTYGGDYVKMHKGNGCWSKLGRSGGAQLLSLGSGCEYVGVVAHELMHAIGIWHEQSRPDRDRHVEVLWQNIEPGQEKNFKKYDHGKVDTLGLSYDYYSVMHYDRFLYSVDGKRPTIIARGKPWIRLGGQLKGTLTSNDVTEINELYDCD